MTIVKQLDPESNTALQSDLQSVIEAVEAAARAGQAAHEVEHEVLRSVLKLGYRILGHYFEQAGDGDQGEKLKLEDGGELRRLPGRHPKSYQSVFGTYKLERQVYGKREGQRMECVPLDARLQLPESSVSYLLQEWSQALAVERAYKPVQALLERMLGITLPVSKLERGNQAMAESVAAYNEATVVAPSDQGEFVVISGDGKGVRMRKPPESAPILAHDSKRGPKPDRKKMAILGSAYDIESYVRTPHQVWQALFHETKEAANEDEWTPRPTPIAKRVRASLTYTDEQGREVNARETIFTWLGEQVRQRNPQKAKEVIVLMDGQECLWEDARQALPGYRCIEILDLLHATSKLWDLVHVFHPSGSPEALNAMKLFTLLLLQGGVDDILVWFRHGARESELTGNERRRVNTIWGYFEKHRQRMRYDEYLAAGLPIASGVIEGACRHVVKDRLECSGMHWTLAGARAMLDLRCVAINGQWEEFTQFRIQRETQRLYPYRALFQNAEREWPIAA